ncbi:MAG: hypothetical protein AB7T49_19575 [Oligoflexales bacterium]
MATSKVQLVETSEIKTQHKRCESASSAPIRVRQKTKAKLEQLLKQANKERLGRRVKPDDLICFGLGLITDDHISNICSSTLSNKDRLELLYLKLSKEKRGITRDEFLGLLLDGKATT